MPGILSSLCDWDEALDDFLAAMKIHYRPNTLSWYAYKLRPLLEWAKSHNVALKEFQRRHLDRFLSARVDQVDPKGKKLSPTTLEKDARCACVLIRYCYQAGYIQKDVLKDYVVKKAPRPAVAKPSPDDLKKLWRAIETRYDVRVNPSVRYRSPGERRFLRTRDYAFIAGLVATGCRVSEMCQLKLADYDPQAKTILFRHTKTGKPRTIPIPDEWIALVEAWLKERPSHVPCDTLFMNWEGNPLNRTSARKRLKTYIAYAGLKQFTQHSFRHYALTEIGKINIFSAARIAGHNDLRTLQTYLHEDPDWIREDYLRANTLGKTLEIPAPAPKDVKRRPRVTKRK